MYKIIKDIADSCEICRKNKTRKGRNFLLLGLLGPPKEPFEIMSLDTAGGFSDGKLSQKYLQFLMDHFTRYDHVSISSTQNVRDFI